MEVLKNARPKPVSKDNTFKWALIISLIAHSIIIITIPSLRTDTYRQVKKVLEVTYDKLTERKDSQRPQSSSSKDMPYTQQLLKDIPLPSLDNKAVNPNIVINKNQKIGKIPMALFDSDKKIDIVGIKSDIPKTQTYELYSEKIRQSIREKAYSNFTEYQEGYVYVSFVVLKDGTLRDILIHNDKSTPDAYLKELVAKSVQDAAPFDKFPLELDYPRITYSVTVSFELQ